MIRGVRRNEKCVWTLGREMSEFKRSLYDEMKEKETGCGCFKMRER